MSKVSLIAAGVIALGWGTARAETGTGAATTTPDQGAATGGFNTTAPAAPAVTPATPAAPVRVDAPNTTVTVPPGSSATITAPDTTSTTTTTTTTPAPGTMPETAPGAPPAPSTNVEINTPPPAGENINNTVVTPAPVQPIQPVTTTPPGDQTEAQQWTGMNAPHVGAGLIVGGGYQNFSRSGAQGVTDPGGYWTARLVFGTLFPIGFEAAYIGSAQSINALGLSNDAVLISNGAEGVLRINLPIRRGAVFMEPFAFGGVGWQRYHVSRSNTFNSSITQNDDILEVPYGGGFEFGYGAFLADARFTYRSTFFTNLLTTSQGSLDNWQAGGQVGFQF
jgi:hypothetical protein